MSEYTKEEIEQAKEDIRKMSEKTRSEPSYKGKAYSDTGPKVGSNIAGGFGGGDIEKGMAGGRFKPLNKAKGGKVSSASKRADGCAVKGKTKGKML